MITTRLHGRQAIDYAADHGLRLGKYSDPIEEAREGLTVEEAEDVAREDPGLIYLDIGDAVDGKSDLGAEEADTPHDPRLTAYEAGRSTIVPLSDRPPVEILDDDWPIIAEAAWHDSEHTFQANRSREIKVREHADGRRLVYGQYWTRWVGESDLQAGYLLEADEDQTVRAIRRVAGRIGDADLADKAIADLPAERI